MNALINALNSGGEMWWRCALHAAWQASLLAVVVLVVVRLGRRWPSPLRYWLLVVALVKFAMPPMLALPTGFFSQVGPRVATTEIALEPEVARVTVEAPSQALERDWDTTPAEPADPAPRDMFPAVGAEVEESSGELPSVSTHAAEPVAAPTTPTTPRLSVH